MRDIKKVLTKPALAAVVAAGIFLPGEAAACGQDSYVGSVCFMATDFCPQGTLPADGSVVAITPYQALYSLLGTRYGGDARNTFGLPDLRGRAAVGVTTSGANQPTPAVTLAAKVGQATQSVSVPVPYHTHTATFTPSGTTPGVGTTAVQVEAITGGEVKITGLTVTNTHKLSATTTGRVNIASSSASGTTAAPASGAVLAKPLSGVANIYSPGGSADTPVGPLQSFSGDVTGTITSEVSGGTVTGMPSIPSFTAKVPVTVTQGKVDVAAAGDGKQLTVATQSPSLGLTACIVANGIYPQRP